MSARPAAVHVISSTSPAPAVARPSTLSVAETFCIFAYVTASFAIVVAFEFCAAVTSPVRASRRNFAWPDVPQSTVIDAVSVTTRSAESPASAVFTR